MEGSVADARSSGNAASGTVRHGQIDRVEAARGARGVACARWNGGTSEMVLGRRRDCDVVLSSAAVSRRHAQLLFRDGNWVIRDLGSTNGTRVNGVRVARRRLRAGDSVAVGDTLLRIG
jgi:pSer/pThr/pTyr-binding forkhead associated (FHA) protein